MGSLIQAIMHVRALNSTRCVEEKRELDALRLRGWYCLRGPWFIEVTYFVFLCKRAHFPTEGSVHIRRVIGGTTS
jgi:hypothetical protein